MTNDVLRSFVAIEVPLAAKHALNSLVHRLRVPGIRASWVTPENMHLTLRFLGDVTLAQRQQLVTLLEQAFSGTKRFPMRIAGTGAFPNLRRPSVVWAGMTPLEGSLADIQQQTEEAVRTIGLAPERRAFQPHLTLARIRDLRGVEPLIERVQAERDFDGGEFTVGSVSLFSSQLTPRGAVYTCLREFHLD